MARVLRTGGRKAKAKSKARKASPAKSRKAAGKKRDVARRRKDRSVQARLTRERDEALERQAATSDILSAISNSGADTQPVFDKILESVERLFDASQRVIFLTREDGLLHVGAVHGSNSERIRAIHPVPLKGTASEIAIRDRRSVTYADVLKDADVPSGLRETARRYGENYAMVAVPLLWKDRAVGSIVASRTSMQPFNDRECALLRTFADQAVIAIENARLFKETKEALARQTATANILRVISNSIADATPVFDEILSSVEHLFGSDDRMILLADQDGLLRIGAIHGRHAEPALALFPVPLKGLAAEIAFSERRLVTYTDVLNDADVPEGLRAFASRYGETYSIAIAPLLTADRAIGVLNVTRDPVRAFTEQECELLQTLAGQAVIAIENARLFKETREALERQTATAEVLKIISTSPAELTPVFDAILANAVRLCDAKFGMLFSYEEDAFHAVGKWQLPPAYSDSLSEHPIRANPKIPMGRVLATKRPVHVADVLTDQSYVEGYPGMIGVANLGGARTLLQVPLLKENDLVGTIAIYRQEVRPFDDKQIALVQNFASQAVIAIENARLFNEVQAKTRDLEESLQQQTATSEVLQVISSSPSNLAPVFENMLKNATLVCGAEFGSMNLVEDDSIRQVALYNPPAAFAAVRANRVVYRAHPQSTLGEAISTRQVVHLADLRTTVAFRERWPNTVELVELGGARTVVVVPLLREDEVIGVITIFRQEVRPFEDKQIELVRNFARQAVIAIENARLLGELRQRTADLSKSLDDLRTAQDRLVQTEKLASLGQLTAGIAHEIKNPLNFVNNFSALSAELVDELDDTLAPAPLDAKMRGEVGELTQLLKSNLEKVVQHGKRADSIVKNMLQHSREGSGEHRAADINAIVEDSLNLAYHGARAEKSGFAITLRPDLARDAGMAQLYPQEITRALLNLISNGFYAATRRKIECGDESFEPVLSASTRNLGNTIEIRIRDNGTGIPPEVREKMFNPFFTTKPTGEGTGLGLSMTHDIIVKQHGGQIDVETEPGVFTEFIITLPRESGHTTDLVRG